MSEFFDAPPRIEEEPEQQQEWDGPPSAVVPVSVPIERVVARSEEASVYLASIMAYPHGFEFVVFVLASETSELDPLDPEHRLLAERTGEIPPGQLRLGFLFADGSKATNTGKYFGWFEESGRRPDAPVMRSGRGVGEAERWHHAFWVWPLPPAGRLEFLCEWPEAGIPMTGMELDAASVIEASKRAREIFVAK